MADTKITGLQTPGAFPVVPSTDVLPIVIVADNSMAASGSTRKVTVNQILGAGGTATLASATISGALDAARLNVTAATIPANGVYLGSANKLSFSAASTLGMTLDATGLGVGVASPSFKLDVLGSATISGRFKTSGALNALYLEDSGTTAGTLYIGTSGNEFRIVTGSNVALAVDVNRNFAIGPTSVTTTATDGFVYIPVCAGAPTGTPTAKGGRAAFVVDSTNNRFYVYVGGAWKYAALV